MYGQKIDAKINIEGFTNSFQVTDLQGCVVCQVQGGDTVRKRRHYIHVTEEQIRQAALELERQENMDLEQEIAEANAWAEANHIVRRPFPQVAALKSSDKRILKPRYDAAAKLAGKNRFRLFIRLVSVLIIVLLGGWYTQTDSVRGLRLDLMNLFVDVKRDKNILALHQNTVPIDRKFIYVPTYLPDHFQLTKTDESLISYTQTYKYSSHWFQISHLYNEDINLYCDSKEQISKLVIHEKYTGSLYELSGVWYIVWYDEHGMCMTVAGNLALEEGEKIVSNLEWR